MSCCEDQMLTRRALLAGGAVSLAMWGFLPRIASAAGTRDPRLLVVVLRGGLDGLSLAAPAGDPDYQRLRPGLALTADGSGAGLPLDGFFILNPNMPFLHGLYLKKEALVIHAVHSPYRGRSHFDGQDVLESGLPGTGRIEDGWLNRALARLPDSGRVRPNGLAIGATVPLVMRGKAPVLSWIPKVNALPLRDQTLARLLDLYQHTDSALAAALSEGMTLNSVDPAAAAGAGAKAQPMRVFTEAAQAAAKLLSSADGPRVGALSYDGWDTHANEGVVAGQLANRLGGLDAAIREFHDGMGAAWGETAVLVVTEFGRTARVNGTSGTDHGMATVALLLGGAVRGGRVLADWPGLADAKLYEGRDVAPTRDLRSIAKGVLRDHLGIPDGALTTGIFPDSAGARPQSDLLT